MKTKTSKTTIKRRKITFSLNLPNAKKVILMGDFNRWNPNKHIMKRDGNGTWTKSVMLLPGRYEYKFLADGVWQEDPQNDLKCINGFSTYNSVFNLTAY